MYLIFTSEVSVKKLNYIWKKSIKAINFTSVHCGTWKRKLAT